MGTRHNTSASPGQQAVPEAMASPSDRESGRDPALVGPKVHDDEELLLFDSSEPSTQASISAQEVRVLGVYRGSMSPVEETTRYRLSYLR